MGALKGMLARLRAVVRPGAADRELDDEIRFHLALETDKNLRLGMAPEEARRRALRDFGGVDRHKEAHLDVRGRWHHDFAADVRYAARGLRRSPVLAATATLTIALGVGANAAIFSAVDAVLFRPLPFPAPERLVKVWEENPEKGWYKQVAAPANVLDWREQVAAFQDVAAHGSPFRTTLTGAGAPRVIGAAQVTGSFFAVLGVRPLHGRGFVEAETWATGTPIAVISERLWRDHYGADPSLVGRTIALNGRPRQVVGIMPAGFAYPSEDTDLWIPSAWKPEDRGEVYFRRAHFLHVVARLKPGVPVDAANAQLQAVVRRLQGQYPETNRVMGAGITPLQEFLVGDTRRPLLLLLGAVAVLLLIACANVANLLLVRAAGRERETALRVALGAGRERLVRQALTESLVLSALGGAAGLALAWWGTAALRALLPGDMLHVSRFGVDWRVLGYVLGVTTASGLLFGVAPALWASRRNAADALRAGARASGEGQRMRRWSEALVVGEVALAVVLVVGAGLLVRSFDRLRGVEPGFDAAGVTTFSVGLPGARYDSDEKAAVFFDDLYRRLRALPGVVDVAGTSALPLQSTGYTSDFTVQGWPDGRYGTEVMHRVVTPEYFRTMRVPLRAGRGFTAEDRKGGAPVVIINEALARKHFDGENPIGRRFTFDKTPDSSTVWLTIVGVAGSEHQRSLREDAQIETYVPWDQERTSGLGIVVRTSCPAAASVCEPPEMTPAIRRIMAAMDSMLVLESVQPVSAIVAKSLARERFLMTLMLGFAIVGLLLAIVGVYGVIAQLVRRRTREMGVRLALGARASQVRWLVVRQGLRLVALGLAAGFVVAFVSGRVLRALLYDISPTDPVTFAAVLATLGAAGLVAAWVPALQASRADPAVTLRGE